MFTNFFKKAIFKNTVEQQIKISFASVKSDQKVGQTQQQNLNNQNRVQVQKEKELVQQAKIIQSRNDIPHFIKQVRENYENDAVSYTESIQMNMLRRIHIHSQFKQLDEIEQRDRFIKRMEYLSTIFPFFDKYYYNKDDLDLPDDNEYVYDIEKIELKEYIKNILFKPGKVDERDLFPYVMILSYIFIFGSWFICDVLIFKVFYSSNEILGIDQNKKYMKSQLKGVEYNMEINENKTKNPQLEQKQQLKLESILNEVKKQADLSQNAKATASYSDSNNISSSQSN
ncbi:hypothetical protein ABPG72_001099 [Tetrahymena utriculariae]